MSRRSLLAWYLTTGLALLAAGVALAPAGERPLGKLFGGGSSKANAAKAASDAARKAEMEIEVAWLADPITFSYFLEARVDGSTLSVRGFVPDKAVREHALKLAREHCSYTVTDALKEHPSLLVRPTKETPAHLQTAVTTVLREALPKQHQNIQVQCAADGTVILRGAVQSVEDRHAASVVLRRLYGCTRVDNQTQLPGAADVAANKKMPPVRDEVAKGNTGPVWVAPPPEAPSKNVLTSTPKQPTEVAKVEPKTETPASAKKDDTVKSTKLTIPPATLAKLEKRVTETCSGAKDIKVVVAMNKLRIEMTVRSDSQIQAFADRVYAIAELAEFREDVELIFAVASDAPGMK
jgi:osmotically-inducible protein OsmY